jgi:hypothetical protein
MRRIANDRVLMLAMSFCQGKCRRVGAELRCEQKSRNNPGGLLEAVLGQRTAARSFSNRNSWGFSF